MITTQIHDVKKVSLHESKSLTTDGGREFVARWLTVETEHGEVTISLIADEEFEVVVK